MQGDITSIYNKPVWTYRVLFRLLSPLVLGYTLWRTYKDGGARYLQERLGIYRSSETRRMQINPAPAEVWIHAASVGEVFTVLPLLKAMGSPILVTTTTPTGAEVLAQQQLPHVRHQYAPLDFSGACNRFFQHANISQGWVVETEIWPWLYASAHAHRVPMTIINARLSHKTSSQASGIMSSAFRRALQQVRILARSEDDAKRFAELGASEASITVVGNLKYADKTKPESCEPPQAPRLLEQPYLLAASTHEDEELQLAHAFHNQTDFIKSSAVLVLVPRHPERGAAIQKHLASHGISATLRSQNQTPDGGTGGSKADADNQIYIADTLGELQAWYTHTIASFVGGSLIKRGGHNMLEAARAGCPIITGPHTFNFTDVVQTLVAEDAIRVAEDANEVVEFFRHVLHEPESFIPMTQRATRLAERSQSVLQRYLNILKGNVSAV